MNLKPLAESKRFKIYRSLNTRMELLPDDRWNYKKLKSGFEGELFFQSLTDKLQCGCYVLNDLLFELNELKNRTVVMVLHDLNLACRYAHNIVAIKDQKVYAQGAPEHVINCSLVKHVFDMDCEVTSDPLFGTPLCIPYGKGRRILNRAVVMNG